MLDIRNNDAACPKAIEEFKHTKAGVKDLADDMGLIKIPKYFIHPPEIITRTYSDPSMAGIELLVIDLEDCHGPKRKAIVEQICQASETWGFFQIVNHSIPHDIMERVLESNRLFHEQSSELKREYCSRDSRKKVRYFSNGNLLPCKVANWKDTHMINFQDDVFDYEALPQICCYRFRLS